MKRCGPTPRLVWRHPNAESIKTRSVICHLHEVISRHTPLGRESYFPNGLHSRGSLPGLNARDIRDRSSDHFGSRSLGKTFEFSPSVKVHGSNIASVASYVSSETCLPSNCGLGTESALVNRMSKPYRKLPSVGHPGHYIREWRLYKNLTQEQVAERIDKGVPQVSKIENGRQNYNQVTLEAFAYALGCEPGDLLKPPNPPKSEIEQLLMKLDADDQAKAIRIIRAMASEEAA